VLVFLRSGRAWNVEYEGVLVIVVRPHMYLDVLSLLSLAPIPKTRTDSKELFG
jgi:hypothetical protein